MKESISKRPSGRVKRPANVARGPLNVRGKEEGFHYRIVNDVDDRIESFKDLGYTVVTEDTVSIGERRVDSPSAEGSVKKKPVGNGVVGVLMKTPKDWFEEAQIEKAEELTNQERAMKREVLDGYKGKFGNE